MPISHEKCDNRSLRRISRVPSWILLRMTFSLPNALSFTISVFDWPSQRSFRINSKRLGRVGIEVLQHERDHARLCLFVGSCAVNDARRWRKAREKSRGKGDYFRGIRLTRRSTAKR